MDKEERITFRVNGVSHTVGCESSSSTTLLQYLRGILQLRGTKYNCLEGGCGACIVSVVKHHGEAAQGVNSCLVSITSCQDWDITTIEKIGNRLDGYHPLQTTLAENYGCQCGYCSPGFVMNMYSLLKAKQLTMHEIEKALGSNICRCTGYRPILDAFKKFASDATSPTTLDIEDLKICDKTGEECVKEKCEHSDWCMISRNEMLNQVLHIKLSDNKDWYRANTLLDVFDIWRKNNHESYMLVAGNTAKGVYPILDYPKLLIDISCVQDLKGFFIDQNLIIGGGNTLAGVIEIFTTVANSDEFKYLNVLKKHLELVAHTTVRNLATLAGNLMIKHRHIDFKSDIFLLLETVGAQITILNGDGLKTILTTQGFLKEDMTGKIILNIIFLPLNLDYKIVTYKIMPRSQSVHALIHAGFLYKLSKENVVKDCTIVYGGLCPQFSRAYNTERYLIGKNLFINETLQGAIKVLNKELVVVQNPPEPSVEYRRKVALGLFYKGLLSLCPTNTLNSRYRSGADQLRDTRSVSEGHQVYDSDPSIWPLNKPIPKSDALILCAGEADYSDDIPSLPGEVFAAFVLAKVPLGTIEKIDTSRAMQEPGVIAFYSASDIPGVNSFTAPTNILITANEEIFCDGEVKYFDQPVGVIVAESQAKANKAATLVDIQYKDVKKPIIYVNIARNDPKRVSVNATFEATSKGTDVFKTIKGNDTIYGQYHFTMETLVAVTVPTEEGLLVHTATQWLDSIHRSISRALKLNQNRIDVKVRRLGGGYGLKVSRTAQIAVAAALVTYKLNRPCRFINPLVNNMRAIGKRMPISRDFEVGVDANGVIQYANVDLYGDQGYVYNETMLTLGLEVYYNCYKKEPWNFTAYNVITDTASNTWCRSPGSLENIAMAEIMIDRIAYELNLDALEVRLANLDTQNHSDLIAMIDTLKSNSRYAERKIAVDTFNKNNRWKKRGLRFSLVNWVPVAYVNYDINLSVYADDGTIVITHGGVEMGQGVNMKAIQICAYMLNVPVEKIQIKPNDTTIVPNCSVSGASLATQFTAVGIKRCCEELLKRLEPVKSQMTNPTWVEMIQKAYDLQIDLQVHDYTTLNDIQNYYIYGVALAETEIDVLTGESQLRQVDLLQDVGRSVNPELDIGQVEGGFMMALGYWTCERLVYDKGTGELLTDRTWEYWVPQALDIPQVLNVYLQKKSYSNDLMLGAKAIGEPPTCLGVVVPLALRAAIAEARRDSGLPSNQWFPINGPYTVEKICTSTATKLEEFRYY